MSDATYVATIDYPDDGFNFSAAEAAVVALTPEQLTDEAIVDNLGPDYYLDPDEEVDADLIYAIRSGLLDAITTLTLQTPSEVRGRPGTASKLVVPVTAEEEEMSSGRTEVDDLYLLQVCAPVFAALYEPKEVEPAAPASPGRPRPAIN